MMAYALAGSWQDWIDIEYAGNDGMIRQCTDDDIDLLNAIVLDTSILW